MGPPCPNDQPLQPRVLVPELAQLLELGDAHVLVKLLPPVELDRNFTYDLNGNVIDGGNRSFEWDAENRLVAVTVKATGHRSEFLYNGARITANRCLLSWLHLTDYNLNPNQPQAHMVTMTRYQFPQHFTLSAMLLLFACTSLGARDEGSEVLARIERQAGGRLGVLALDTVSGRTLAYRAGERFLMCSTFKLLLAAHVLQEVESGRTSLDRVLRYDHRDLLAHAPVTKAHAGEGGMTVASLCEAIITLSDNTAANLLLREVGGPPAFTAFARSLGDRATRLDRNEPSLNEAKGEWDTTTPEAMAATVRRLVLEDALSTASRKRLEGWLRSNATGARSLKAGLPAGWTIADKTGMGPRGEVNDIGILFPPQGGPIVVAAYFSGRSANPSRRENVMEDVGRAVAIILGEMPSRTQKTASSWQNWPDLQRPAAGNGTHPR